MTILGVLAVLGCLAQQGSGVAPTWDIGKLFTDLSAQSARLQPVLQQLKPKEWTGAPDSYATLLASTVEMNQALAAQAAAAAQHPEKLSPSLQVLLAVHAIETNAAQLAEGLRKYGNPALADLLSGIMTEGAPARQAFAQRVTDLAAEREQQFETADHEAQRCREMLSRNPGAERRPVKSR